MNTRIKVFPDADEWVAALEDEPGMSWIAPTRRDAIKGLLTLLAGLDPNVTP